MLSFKEYITELFDSPYEYQKVGVKRGDGEEDGDSHRYVFKDHTGRDVHVNMIHHPDNKTAEVVFSRYGSVGLMHDAGPHAGKIFSTVRKIATDHAKKHRKLEQLTFSSSKVVHRPGDKAGSRASLYARLARSMGGSTKENKLYDDHTIPVNKGKK